MRKPRIWDRVMYINASDNTSVALIVDRNNTFEFVENEYAEEPIMVRIKNRKITRGLDTLLTCDKYKSCTAPAILISKIIDIMNPKHNKHVDLSTYKLDKLISKMLDGKGSYNERNEEQRFAARYKEYVIRDVVEDDEHMKDNIYNGITTIFPNMCIFLVPSLDPYIVRDLSYSKYRSFNMIVATPEDLDVVRPFAEAWFERSEVLRKRYVELRLQSKHYSDEMNTRIQLERLSL